MECSGPLSLPSVWNRIFKNVSGHQVRDLTDL